jgi:acetyl-CoA carboxylase carboxyltransferase component
MIITFVDTPGADPTEESEEGGIAWRIGETIQRLIESNTPTLSLIINRVQSRVAANALNGLLQSTSDDHAGMIREFYDASGS